MRYHKRIEKSEIAELAFSLLIIHLKYIREADTLIPNSAFLIPNLLLSPAGSAVWGYIPARERVFRGERILLSIDRQCG